MENIEHVLIVGIIFGTIYGVIRIIAQRRERLLIIEKGTNLPELKEESSLLSSLKFGLLFVGIGLGVFAGNILTATTRLLPEVAYFSMVFLFGGLALIIHYLIEGRRKNG